MKKVFLMFLSLCLLLSGCGFFDGTYSWEDSHPMDSSAGSSQESSADTYAELYRALTGLVAAGVEQGTVFVEKYDAAALEKDIARVVADVRETDPVTAYAVEDMICEQGTGGGKAALSVKISYVHDKSEIRKIQKVADQLRAKDAIADALIACETGIVLQIENYEETDFVQLVADYALEYPQYVMEAPQVNVNIYPESGKTRVVELKFSYETSRESLKTMQDQVKNLFSSAELFVSDESTQEEVFSQLYGFLMNRFEYQLQASITPAYHLLWHGVGDSKAFATVYGAMCRQVELDCRTVSGTLNGASYYWNLIFLDGQYYHVDLLACKQEDRFCTRTAEQMKQDGYVWDYSAYPPYEETARMENP